MKKLRISEEISFPQDAITQTLAAIGRKGSGKTYLATMIAEQMLDIEAQVVIIDPVGNWWGLRVGPDGKSKGKDIFIIGGEHGDIPLVPEGGRRIAQLIVEKNVSAVLDVSGFRIGEHKKFAADFAEEFFQLKKSKRSPVHIFIEEAQKLIPQRVGPDEARMVGAFEQIVRLGRNYGIGCTLITQRPQSVNKEVLSQVECLCVLQVTGPHERKALEEWVYEVGADRTLIGELPGLSQGEGYVWSPSWLRIYKRVHFAKKQTFDASATPEIGKATKAAKLLSVDVNALKKDMEDIIAQAEMNDPKIMRKKIAEYTKRLNGKETVKTMVSEKIVEKKIITDSQIKRLESIFSKMVKEAERHGSAMSILWGHFNELGRAMESVVKMYSTNAFVVKNLGIKRFSDKNTPGILKENLKYNTSYKPVKTFTNTDAFDGDQDVKPLRLGAMRMLNWLATLSPLSKQRIATLSGFSVSGGTFNTYLSELKRNGWIKDNGDSLSITEEGMKHAEPADMPTGEDLLTLWTSKFRDGAAKMLRYIYSRYPNRVSKEEIAEETGFEASGGTFNTYLSELRRNGLISKIDDDGIVISDEFFT